MSAIEPSPARRLTSETEAIETARQVAAQIAELAADPRNNGQLPHRQAELLSSSGLTAIAVPAQFGDLRGDLAGGFDGFGFAGQAAGGGGFYGAHEGFSACLLGPVRLIRG